MNGLPYLKRTWDRKKGSWFIKLLLFISYFFAISLSLAISYLCIKKYTWVEQPSLVISWVIVVSVFLIVFLLQGLYQERMAPSRKREIFLIVKAVLVSSILLAILLFASQRELTFNQQEGLLFFFLSSLVLIALFRSVLFFHLRRYLLKKDIGVTRVLIVGVSQEGRKLSEKLEQIDPFKYRVVGFVEKEGEIKTNGYNSFKVIGKLEDIDKLIKQHKIDEIYVAGESVLPMEVLMLVEKCRDLVEKIYVAAEIFELLNGKVSLGKLKGAQLLKIMWGR